MTTSSATTHRVNPERFPKLRRSSLHSRFQLEQTHLNLRILMAVALTLAMTATAALI